MTDDPKKPKLPRITLTDNRDRPKTPSAGRVVSQSKHATPHTGYPMVIPSTDQDGKPENFDSDTGTPVGSDEMEKLLHRSKVTKDAALETKEMLVNNTVMTSEVKMGLNEFKGQFEGELGKLQGEFAGFRMLLNLLLSERRQTQEVTTFRQISEVEVDKHRAITQIDDEKDERKSRRKLVYKAVAITGTVVTAVVTALATLLTHC